jgi:hypothetical protein
VAATIVQRVSRLLDEVAAACRSDFIYGAKNIPDWPWRGVTKERLDGKHPGYQSTLPNREREAGVGCVTLERVDQFEDVCEWVCATPEVWGGAQANANLGSCSVLRKRSHK